MTGPGKRRLRNCLLQVTRMCWAFPTSASTLFSAGIVDDGMVTIRVETAATSSGSTEQRRQRRQRRPVRSFSNAMWSFSLSTLNVQYAKLPFLKYYDFSLKFIFIMFKFQMTISPFNSQLPVTKYMISEVTIENEQPFKNSRFTSLMMEW